MGFLLGWTPHILGFVSVQSAVSVFDVTASCAGGAGAWRGRYPGYLHPTPPNPSSAGSKYNRCPSLSSRHYSSVPAIWENAKAITQTESGNAYLISIAATRVGVKPETETHRQYENWGHLQRKRLWNSSLHTSFHQQVRCNIKPIRLAHPCYIPPVILIETSVI